MDILFRTSALRTACNEEKKGIRKFGQSRFGKIRLRMDQMNASANLSELPPSARCHELKGNRAGQLAVHLDSGWRLVFVPSSVPPPVRADGGLDWTKVTAIEIIGVVDYHD